MIDAVRSLLGSGVGAARRLGWLGALRGVVATVGLVAVGAAGALVVAPERANGLLPVGAAARTTPLSAGDIRALTFGLVGLCCLLWVRWTAGPTRVSGLPGGPFGDANADFETLQEYPPEHAAPGDVVGERFDTEVMVAATAPVDDSRRDAPRKELRKVAVEVVADARGCSTERAEELVAAGEWTDDPVAAAYVADREGSLSLGLRLLAWLRPRKTTVDRIERSIAAIEDRVEEGVE